MPVHELKDSSGKVIGHQWGSSGKKYYGKDSKKKAAIQGAAVRASGWKGK